MQVRRRIPTLTAAQAARLAPEGARLYAAGCLGEPTAILDAVSREPDAWRRVRVTGAFIPGVNDRDLSALGTGTRVETIFATAGLRPGRSAGRVDLMPLHYSAYERWLGTPGTVDIAFITVTAPDGSETVGFGPSADFSPAVLAAGARAIGIVNPNLPDVADGPRVSLDRFEALVEDDAELVEYDAGEPDAATERIAEQIAAGLAPGDTLQLGLGKLQTAMLRLLKDARGLSFHGGMLSDAFLEAWEAGAFTRGVVTGVALGRRDFVHAAARATGIAFRPVGVTHAAAVLAAIPRLVSVNSALEVDLFGQANAEFLGDAQISGHGGMVDFVRGARASPGGRAILALPASARGGAVSRIVPALGAGRPVSLARSDADMVATEHGIARLRHAGADARAKALTAIAAPQFRDGLAAAWRDMRQRGTAGKATA